MKRLLCSFLLLIMVLSSSFAQVDFGCIFALEENVTDKSEIESGITVRTDRWFMSAMFDSYHADYALRYQYQAGKTLMLQADFYLDSALGLGVAPSIGQDISLGGFYLGYRVGVQSTAVLFLDARAGLAVTPMLYFNIGWKVIENLSLELSAGTTSLQRPNLQMAPVLEANAYLGFGSMAIEFSMMAGLSEFWWEELCVSFVRGSIGCSISIEKDGDR
jgi:hypothetical protein